MTTNLDMSMRPIMLLLLVVGALPLSAQAQAMADSGDSSGTLAIIVAFILGIYFLRNAVAMGLHDAVSYTHLTLPTIYSV